MSGPTYPNLWGWVSVDEARLRREGGEKATIADNWQAFGRYHHANFAAADHAINVALDAARAAKESRWELFLRHWRLQLWLADDLHRVLPEAVDLVSTTMDDAVRDVPQRVCAFHDLVDCYVRMDARGYHDDIVANSEDVLAQLPKRYNCADCARLHMAHAAGAVGDAAAAERHLADFAANAYDRGWPGAITEEADVYELIGKWPEAESTFRRAFEVAQKRRDLGEYALEATLGIARARAAQGDADEAIEQLLTARRGAKYTGNAYLIALLLETEGVVAEAAGHFEPARDFFVRAARQYLDLARYRQAAEVALRVAERSEPSEREEALGIAAEAVGAMPATSVDVRQRLAELGREPLVQREADPAMTSGMQSRELAALEETLAARVAHRDPAGVAVALFRIGRWHAMQDQPRAALDYYISDALLERMLELTMYDREDALNGLKALREILPVGTVEAALVAAESGPPALLVPLISDVQIARWRWLVRSLAAEMAGQPAVEPVPEESEGRAGFESWLEHVVSMTTLIVRFRDRLDAENVARWVAPLDEMVGNMRAQADMPTEGGEVIELVEALARLGHGADPEEVQATALRHVASLVEQIRGWAAEPVWRHPGSSPLDFLVEHSAQRAVRALRLHDDHRDSRLENMRWRFALMNYDLLAQERLQPIARFMMALQGLLKLNGERLPEVEPPLDAPFETVLKAVYEAGRSAAAE